MRTLPLPEYTEPVARFIHVEDPDNLVVLLETCSLIAVDTETYYDPAYGGVIRFIDTMKNNVPFGLSVTVEQGNDYVSYWVTGPENIKKLKPILENERIAKILHNSKYDMHMLKNLGIDLKGYIWDTMVMIHLIDEEHMCRTPDGKQVMSKSLKNLAYHYLGEDGHVYEDLVSEVRRVVAMNSERVKSAVTFKEANDAAPEIMKDYACSDTEFTFRLWKTFLPELSRQSLEKAYEIDINATRAVFEMERAGLGVDMEYYERLEAELTDKLLEITDKVSTIIPIELNIRSSRDLVQGFEGLGVEWMWFTEKGEYRTDDRILRQFQEGKAGELASLVIDYRDTAKTRDTFISQINTFNQNGRIHADFNVCPRDNSEGGTVTGRLSSNSPNLHNLPKDDSRIRKGIVPEKDFVFVEMDYDQQEYRLLAHYAKDENFMAIVKAGKDIHTGTAEMMFNLTHEEASEKKNRSKGKTLNFGMVYGLGKAHLASNLGYKINSSTYNMAMAILRKLDVKPWAVPHRDDLMVMVHNEEDRKIMEYYFSDEAQSAIREAGLMRDKYFSQFPAISVFLKDCGNAAKRRGWVKTWSGRRRHFKDATRDGYKGPNSVIQGGCGDIIKMKMFEITEYLRPYQSRAVNNIHDALLFEIHKDEMHLLPEIKKIMEDLPFSVPITCSVEISTTSWAELEKYNGCSTDDK